VARRVGRALASRPVLTVPPSRTGSTNHKLCHSGAKQPDRTSIIQIGTHRRDRLGRTPGFTYPAALRSSAARRAFAGRDDARSRAYGKL